MPIGAGLRQAYELRDATAREAIAFLAVEPPADPIARSRRASAVAALVKAWEAACERIRIARGQPLPGTRRPKPKPEHKRPRRTGLAEAV
jgi:hypothetical protein